MKINYFDKSIHSVEVCCDALWTWVNEGMLVFDVSPDIGNCRAILRTTEAGEQIRFCPFCGYEVGFNHE